MTKTDGHETHAESAQRASRLRRAQQALDDLFRSLPPGRRLVSGLVMAFKAVGAASLAYAIGHALHTEQAFWAAITAIGITQPHYKDTRGQGRDQCMGAAFGGIAGLLGLWTGGPGDFASYALALAVVTVACWTANAGAAARLGGITATIVLLVPSHDGPAWSIAFYRLGEVALGTVCAVVVGWLVSLVQDKVEMNEEAKGQA